MAALQRRLKGVWQATDGTRIIMEIRPNAGKGGVVRFYHGSQRPERLYDRVDYQVISKDEIQLMDPLMAYRVTFWKNVMAWALPGPDRRSRKAKRRFVGLHLKPAKRL
jgi:hypothetical protein